MPTATLRKWNIMFRRLPHGVTVDLRHVPIALLEKGFWQFQTFGHEGDYEVLDQNQFV